MQMIGKLYAISTRPGPAARRERLAALAALALVYGTGDGYGHHDKLAKVQDEFAMQRTAETLWRSYFAESLAAFPEVPLDVSIELTMSLPRPASFDADFQKLMANMADFRTGGFDHNDSLRFFDLQHVGDLARRLLLDRRQEADLRAKVLDLAARLGPHDGFRRDQSVELAKNLRAIGEYGKSTALLSSLGAGEKNPRELESLARQIEVNRELQKALEAAPLKKLCRELLFMMPNAWDDSVQDEERGRLVKLARPLPWDRYVLGRARRLQRGDYAIVDGVPAWLVAGNDDFLATGPRTDPLRGSELRFYGKEALVVREGVPRKDVVARFTISYAPPDDFWPGTDNPGRNSMKDAAPSLDPHHPEVGFAFGLRDLSSSPRGLELVVAADGVRLVEGGKVLARADADLRAPRVDVEVRVEGTAVAGSAGGKSFRFDAPADRTGFYGLAFRGPGFAAVSGWSARKP
jgi:hypothetical protein